MKHLCYIYINKYKHLQNIEAVIDPSFSFEYDYSDRKLRISPNDKLPKNFWSIGIHSLACIVGNNGSGKSTLLCCLLEVLTEGYNKKDFDGVLVFEQNNEFSLFGSNISDIKVYSDYSYNRIKDPQRIRINSFYYSGHPMTGYSIVIEDPRCFELSGSYIATDSWLLIKDLQDYLNKDSLTGLAPLFKYKLAFEAQNNYRICMLLANSSLKNTLLSFSVPKYVCIGINQSGKLSFDIEEISVPEIPINSTTPKNRFYSELIYHNLLNVAHDQAAVVDLQNILHILNLWKKFLRPEDDVLDQFDDFVSNSKKYNISDYLNYILVILKEIDKIGTFQDNEKSCYVDVNDKDRMFSLSKLLRSPFYLTSRFFDLYYAQSLEGNTVLSSGEQELLNLFSRLYDAIELKPEKFCNIGSSCFIMLDEAEIGFHPEWQRRYIKLIVDFLSNVLVKPGIHFQIIITTHSPILLSDIPGCCVTYLKKDKNGVTHNAKQPESFASNVFRQYRNGFFMENGLVGEFASNKIEAILNRIETEDPSGLLNEINMIGDERIQMFLIDKMAKKDSYSAEKFYRDKIDYIRRARNEHD